MHRLTTTSSLAAVLFSLVASAVSAQSRGCGSAPNAFELAIGVAQSDRLDESASPVQFGGRGPEARVGFDHSVAGLCFTSSARGGQRLLSATTGTSGSERLIDGDARLALLKPIASSTESRNWFAAGLELRASLAATRHRYSDPLRSTSTFRMGYASLGPSAMWRRRFGRDAASIQLSTPLVAVIDHPYSPIWTNDAMPHLRGASVESFRGVNGALAYSIAPNRRLSTVLTYGFSALRYDDARTVRSLTQTISAGMRVRLSGGK